MECPENESEKKMDTQSFEDGLMPSKEEIKLLTASFETTTQEEVSKKEKTADKLTSADSLIGKHPGSTDSTVSTLWSSTQLASDDSTPDLFECTPVQEEVKSLVIKPDNNVIISTTPNVHTNSLDTACGKERKVQSSIMELSDFLEINSDRANSTSQSSTPVSQQPTKSRVIGCQSTPSGPEGSQENAPQLSISTPDLFLKGGLKSNTTPLPRERVSLSDDDIFSSRKDVRVSSSLDINDDSSTERVLRDDSLNRGALETKKSFDDAHTKSELRTSEGTCDNFKVPVPQHKRYSEKRRNNDLTDDSGSDLPSNPKKPCLNSADSRKSITIVEEIRKSPPPTDSQDILLQYSASQPDNELGLSSDSIVPIDEEDEVMEVPNEPKDTVLEITLDGSNRTPSPVKSQDNFSGKQSSTETEPVTPSDEGIGKFVIVVKKIVVVQTFNVECRLKANASTGKIVDCSIIQFEEGETSVREDLKKTSCSADSSGVLADESSPPSPPKDKRDSLGSTVSGPGPFPLQPSALQRMSMFSTTSSSSTGSANNGLPNKGLPLRANANVWKSNKNYPFDGVPIAQWKPGSEMEALLKSTLVSFVQKEPSTNLNGDLERRARKSCSSTKNYSTEEDDADLSTKTDQKKTTEPLSPIIEESTSSENIRIKKDVGTPTTPSRRTPQRLQSRKTKEKTESGQETPKSERRRRGRPSPALKEMVSTATPKTPSIASAGVESPHTPLTPGTSALQPGVKLFAMWTDKKFYPAELIERIRDGHWKVQFLNDNFQKVLPERSVLPFSTFECDQAVLSRIPGDVFYDSGKITHVEAFENKDDLYTVTLDNGSTVEVTWRDLSLSEHHAQTLLDSLVQQKPASSRLLFARLVDLDNLVHGKRLRSARCPSPTAASSSKTFNVSSPGNTIFKECEEPDASLTITGIESEISSVDPLAGKGSKRGKGKKGIVIEKPRNPEDEELLERLGPIPSPDSHLFTGLTFFITSTSLRLRHEHKSLNSDVSGGSLSDTDGYTDCECYAFSTLPFVKPRLAEQLRAGGGRVMKNVDELEPDLDKKTVFVVTDRPCRTAVYVRCLALGIRSILHDWIVVCCKENKPLSMDQLCFLPAGYSNLERRFIQWSEIKDRKAFLDKGILVQSQSPSFVSFWEKVARSAGAKIVSVAELEMATIIVGEHPLPDFLMLKAQAAGVPVVSADWVTQSIINGDPLSLDASPQFCLLFSESE